jgi:hypothetical protein
MQKTKPEDRKDDHATPVRADTPGKLGQWKLRKVLSNLYVSEMKILNPPQRVKGRRVP